MAQTEFRSKRMESPSLPRLTPTGLAAIGEKRMEEFAKAQSVIFNTLQETHRRWLDHVQSEARLASEFAERVTNARSLPEAVAACREWTSQRFAMMAGEGAHLLAESQKVVETSARFLSNGPFDMNEQAPGTETAGDLTIGDRQPLHAPGHHAGPAIVSVQHVAVRSDSVQDPRSSGEAASL
jgi:hypothetical protein